LDESAKMKAKKRARMFPIVACSFGIANALLWLIKLGPMYQKLFNDLGGAEDWQRLFMSHWWQILWITLYCVLFWATLRFESRWQKFIEPVILILLTLHLLSCIFGSYLPIFPSHGCLGGHPKPASDGQLKTGH
jgi:type II secretory pathway component PulF